MRREAPFKSIAKLALNLALVSSLFGQSLPAMAQYSLEAEQDSLLPPEVVPLDPSVAQKMAQDQAQARQNFGSNTNGQNAAMAGSPMANNGMSSGNMGDMNGQNNGQMNNGQNNGQMNNMAQGQFDNSNQGGGQGGVPGSTGTSDWIMPGQDQSSPMTAYGNVSQTQTLSAPPSNPIVRRTTRRGGMGTAVSALAGFGAGALVGTMIRRPNSMYGLGMTGLMMTGFGTRNAFRF